MNNLAELKNTLPEVNTSFLIFTLMLLNEFDLQFKKGYNSSKIPMHSVAVKLDVPSYDKCVCIINRNKDIFAFYLGVKL